MRQGMNELVAPIYYAFCAELEADPSVRDAVAALTGSAGREGQAGASGEAGGGTEGGQAAASEGEDAALLCLGNPAAPSSASPAPAPAISVGSRPCAGRASMEAAEADAFFCFTALMAEV